MSSQYPQSGPHQGGYSGGQRTRRLRQSGNTPTPTQSVSNTPRNQSPAPGPAQATGGRSNLAQVKDAGKSAWRGLKRSLEKGSNLCAPLGSAFCEVAACIDIVQASAANRDDYEEMANELNTTLESLNRYISMLEAEKDNGSVARISRSIKSEAAFIEMRRAHGKVRRTIESTQDQEDIIRCYRRIESLFRQLQSDITLRSWETTDKQYKMLLLGRLFPVDDARYDSSYSTTIKRRGCTARTREQVQVGVQDWVLDPNGASVYWMNGMAGTGKTTIAYSLCMWLEENQLLGASFFCSRISSSCRNVNKIVPSIASQLAQYSPAFRSAVCRTLEENPTAGTLNVVRQFEKLVRDPLQKVENAMPEGVTIVIDALDECEDSYGMRLILETLLRLAIDLPLRFLITSRPEPAIQDKMLAPGGYTPSMLHLHDIEESLVEDDIRKYLREALADVSPAPSEQQIKRLARRSGKLFIYAATVVRYVVPDRGCSNPAARLEAVLAPNSRLKVGSSKKYQKLDELYEGILTAAFNEDLESDETMVLKLVLWTVVCAMEPMTAQTMALLLDVDEQLVYIALRPLQSVLHISEISGLVSALHASFPDYMIDLSRSGWFYCDARTHHELLTRRCFRVMKQGLKFNICSLESSYIFDEDIPNLRGRVDQAIRPVLFYACRHWASHILQCGYSETLYRMLSEFLTRRLLFWVEVLNLKQCTVDGEIVLAHTESWVSTNKAPGNTMSHIADAKNFVIMFATSSCSRSTCHLYLSAVEFLRKATWVYAHFHGRLRGAMMARGALARGMRQAALVRWDIGSPVNSVAISSDSTHIVSGSSDKTIRVWDARTGDLVAGPFNGHTKSVTSVAFSPGGTHIVSGSVDKTIRVWDARTGDVVAGPFKGHESLVSSVAFSPDGTRIASGSSDSTIRLWDVRNGDLAADPFSACSLRVNSVAFSPGGTHIISCSNKKSIRMWDARTGVPVAGTFEGHVNSINSAAFSPDGTRIVTGSWDRTIRMWDAQTGNPVADPFEGHTDSITSVSFSPDGAHIVSGSRDKTVRVWDAQTGDVVAAPFKGHTNWVNTVAFFPDGTRIVSGSNDKTIRVWDARTDDLFTGPFKGHTGLVNSVAFSPDGTCIASSSSDNTIRMWDVQTSDPVAGAFKGHTDSVNSVAFSSNGTRIVSSSWDNTIRVWDARTSDLIVSIFEGHTDSVNSVAFSPEGARIVSGSSDETIRVWDAYRGTLIAGPFKGHTSSVNSVAFSPDGTRIVSGSSDSTIRVWDVRTGGRAPSLFDGHKRSVISVAFSPDGTRIVSGSADKTIRVWDARIRHLVAGPFTGHTESVTSVAFSPDGARIASGSPDKTIRVWDARTGGLVAAPFKGHTDSVNSVAFSPDGTRIVSGSNDGTIRVWGTQAMNPYISGGSRPSGTVTGRWTFNSDGWVTCQGKPLFWVPPDLHEYFPRPPALVHIFEHGSISVDYSHLLLGEKWTECYVDE